MAEKNPIDIAYKWCQNCSINVRSTSKILREFMEATNLSLVLLFATNLLLLSTSKSSTACSCGLKTCTHRDHVHSKKQHTRNLVLAVINSNAELFSNRDIARRLGIRRNDAFIHEDEKFATDALGDNNDDDGIMDVAEENNSSDDDSEYSKVEEDEMIMT